MEEGKTVYNINPGRVGRGQRVGGWVGVGVQGNAAHKHREDGV